MVYELYELTPVNIFNNKCSLMCFEKDYNFCHRKIVAEKIKEVWGE